MDTSSKLAQAVPVPYGIAPAPCGSCSDSHGFVITGPDVEKLLPRAIPADLGQAQELAHAMNVAYAAGRALPLDALRDIAYEPFGPADATHEQVLGEITTFARDALAQAGGR